MSHSRVFTYSKVRPSIDYSNIRLYKITVRTILMYGSKTGHSYKHENTLAFFDRKHLKEINGPPYEHDNWRISNNNEFTKIFGVENIGGAIKGNRLRWVGYYKTVKRIFSGKFDGTSTRTRGTQRKR